MERMSIKALRVERGMTQAEFARALQVNKKTVSAWELGKTCPKLDKIEAICATLGVEYDSIRWNV